VREQVPDAVSIFILPPSRAALEERMRKRGQDSEAVMAQRLAAAREEMSHYGEFDYVIVNEHFETAVDDMCAIFRASRLRKDAQVARHARLITALLADGE
jgi:guanylate kinase